MRFYRFWLGPMDIKQLRYFVAIVEEGSFSKAAQRVRIAQPALSLQVRKMEEALQTKLLLRGPQGVLPTEAGELLVTSARKILTDLSNTEDDLRSMGREPSGVVRIGRCWQTNSNQSPQGQGHCPLIRAETAPLGKSSGAVEFEIRSS
ncbi:regulatory helix-turn-helix protein, lysR family [Roseovarius azorensis]|uniref:Regulatory helix-turn-helix protein, lysR family n=1 Tax=Roseovarius azorensis TaxID=1287727 RepID=A0A1H7XS22_9RHOB|nr:LysR family transcriptional regulator [Roseovarius azorensis]SEM36551.1 regulatory helix-turn-helix protein, lysR family [Roseovarius azorensis]